MLRKLAVMMALAMVIAIAGVAYNGGIAAADEPVPPFSTPEDGNEPVDQQQVETHRKPPPHPKVGM
ncbi:MAG: hypothetical protein OXH22_07905 [Chloroflexi bacterium]|nr:hypothetical protein [Chloroflexota bacterium]